MTTPTDKRAEYIAGLRAIADALEADTALCLPHDGSSPDYSRLSVFTTSKDELLAWARAIPGTKTKAVNDVHSIGTHGFELTGAIRGVHLLVYGDRNEVCERVVTGTQSVTRRVPAPDTPMVEVTETVETVEWVCSPLLADAVSA